MRESGGGHVITSDGTSLLGADDKAGVAAMMELICRIVEKNIPHPRLLFFFTVDEEIGEFASDLPHEIFSEIDVFWTIDGTTLGTINTGSLKIIRYLFTFTGTPFPLEGKIQVLIDFKGRAGHSGLNPHILISALSAACDFLSTLMDRDISCRPVFFNGNPSQASLIFACDGQIEYRTHLKDVLRRHKGIRYSIEQYPLGSAQFCNPSLQHAADLGQSLSGLFPSVSSRGASANGSVNSSLVKTKQDNPGSCIIPIEIRAETDEGLQKLEDRFLEVEQMIGQSLPENISMEKERQVICDNIALPIARNRYVLKQMCKAMVENDVEAVEQFVAGGTDGGMINLKHKHLPCPNIGTGAERIHSEEEHISVEDLEKLADILTSYIKNGSP